MTKTSIDKAPSERQVKLIEEETLYEGFRRFCKYTLRHTLFQGGWSAPIEREIYVTGHAAFVLPYDPRLDAVLLVEQFRAGAFAAGYQPWIMECIAGMVEPGETPEQTIRREAVEEAGCAIEHSIKIAELYASPGTSAEYLHIFCATADLTRIDGVHGNDHEHEDIRPLVSPLDDALASLGTPTDDPAEDSIPTSAPTRLALEWLARNKARLSAPPG